MKQAIEKLFRRRAADEVAQEQMFEADRLYLEHQAAGELHAGLAAIYKMRGDRLRAHTSAKVPRLVAAK